jgi:hypothetical protein
LHHAGRIPVNVALGGDLEFPSPGWSVKMRLGRPRGRRIGACHEGHCDPNLVGVARRARGHCERRKNQVGADRGCDQLHDELQFDGGELPGRLRCPGHSAYDFGDDNQQCNRQLVVPDELHHLADQLSDVVCQDFTLAVENNKK